MKIYSKKTTTVKILGKIDGNEDDSTLPIDWTFEKAIESIGGKIIDNDNIIIDGERYQYRDIDYCDDDKVINMNGTEIYYNAAVELMDDEIREELANSGDYEDGQEFFTAYEKAHLEKYGEEWFLSQEHPVY